jgi:transcription initiation factor TFIIB
MVISDRIQNITMPERRDFKNSETESRRRTGIPVSLARYDMGLATVIANTNRDASGRPLGTEMRARMQRLRTWDLRTSYTYLDKNLTQAFDELDILKDKLALSDAVVEKAAYIYRKVEDRGLIRGRTISGIMAAAIYAVMILFCLFFLLLSLISLLDYQQFFQKLLCQVSYFHLND